jgi:hypothetical protein
MASRSHSPLGQHSFALDAVVAEVQTNATPRLRDTGFADVQSLVDGPALLDRDESVLGQIDDLVGEVHKRNIIVFALEPLVERRRLAHHVISRAAIG